MASRVVACPEHGAPSEPDHRFCEACGRDLITGAPAAAVHPPPRAAAAVAPPWISSRRTDRSCPGCGAARFGDGDYCDHCGRRRTVGRDRAELDLGVLAGATDRARRRRNEDAIALGRSEGASVAVLCDGVSTSTRADVASHAAVEASVAAILAGLVGGAEPAVAVRDGARAAALAARATAAAAEMASPPSCTFVCAVVTAESVTVGWIGDSRAYWVSAVGADPACLTIDDSVVGQLAAGRPVPPGADADPGSRALIRWLGADSTDSEPQVVTMCPAEPGQLVLCSDGLSDYLPEPADLASAIPDGASSPIVVARDLTRLALEAGGHDNIAVAVLPFPPVDASRGAEN